MARARRQLNNDDETNDINPTRRRRKKRAPVGKILLLVLLIAIFAGIISIFAIRTAYDLFGFNQGDTQQEIIISNGMGLNDISKMLKDEGIINQSSTFTLYAKLRNRDGIFQAGEYFLKPHMGYDQIILALRSVNVIKEEVTITFYEGMSATEIANLLEKKEVCDAEEFLSAVNSATFGYEFEDMLPENDLRFRKLEGYLFPDTYNFFVGENVNSVIKKFLNNFNNKVFPELYEEIQDSGMTLDEAVTLASIIQEEASHKDHMYDVSSVFHNRIDNPSAGLPRLQSDVTIFYVEKSIKPYQTHSTQDMYDAYNTYECKGLPVGPICSPGLEAIKAAVNPSDTNYYFFVTDVNGKYYYSKTLNEHDRNVRLASSVGETHGTGVQN